MLFAAAVCCFIVMSALTIPYLTQPFKLLSFLVSFLFLLMLCLENFVLRNYNLLCFIQEEAANLAEQMLEKALELVAARKYVEYEHEADARARVKEAVEKEIVAEMNIESAHNDVVMANDEFNLVESYDAEYEDEERRRDLSVLHAAKHIEEDATHSFDEAHKAMDEAMNGVRRTKDTLKSLEENEKALKYALSEFYKLKREYYATHGSEAKQ